jgi:hypothetical protein
MVCMKQCTEGSRLTLVRGKELYSKLRVWSVSSTASQLVLKCEIATTAIDTPPPPPPPSFVLPRSTGLFYVFFFSSLQPA